MARKTRNQRKAKSQSASSAANGSSYSAVLSTYRPVIDGLLYVLALIGVIVTVHLWIQQEIVGFSQGCWGFNPPTGEAAATSDCAIVAQSDAGKLFGISNVNWGIGFYLVIAALGFLITRTAGDRMVTMKRARGVLIAIGFFFSMYLSNYQYGLLQQGVIQEACKLCLVSAGVATSLFVLVLIDLFTSQKAAAEATSPREVASSPLYAVLPIVAVLLLVGDFVWFNNLKPDPGEVASQEAASQRVQPVADENATAACVFDERQQPVPNYRSLLTAYDPTVGPEDAPVTVIEYFDPNCPHCQALHPIMKDVMENYKDRVQFVYKPFALSQRSLVQIEAMYAAQEQDKFSEMLDAQMALEETGGLPIDRVRDLAAEIGMDVPLLNTRLRSELYRQRVIDVQNSAREVGLSSVPAVIVNGRFVGTRSQECIEQFIEESL